jgi:lipopolysaccharide transport system permease protein
MTQTTEKPVPPAEVAAAPLHHRTILPAKRGQSFDVRELWDFREAAYQFARRDVTLRYRQTAMGVVWVVLQPLLAALIFTFLFEVVGHMKAPNHGNTFFFIFSGMMMWGLFSNTFGPASMSVLANNSMLPKVYFPRVILPLYVIASCVINFLVALALFLIFIPVFHGTITLSMLTLPIWIVLLVLMAEGLGLIAAAYTVRYRDVQYVIPVLLQFLLLATPVAYAATHIPKGYRWIATVNPMTGLIEGARWALLGAKGAGVGFQWGQTLYSVGWIVALLALGAVVFGGLERRFADVI